MGRRHSGHNKAPEVRTTCSTHVRHRLCPQWRPIGSWRIPRQVLQMVSSWGASASPSSFALFKGALDFFGGMEFAYLTTNVSRKLTTDELE